MVVLDDDDSVVVDWVSGNPTRRATALYMKKELTRKKYWRERNNDNIIVYARFVFVPLGLSIVVVR